MGKTDSQKSTTENPEKQPRKWWSMQIIRYAISKKGFKKTILLGDILILSVYIFNPCPYYSIIPNIYEFILYIAQIYLLLLKLSFVFFSMAATVS